jgi:hypothetical protein
MNYSILHTGIYLPGGWKGTVEVLKKETKLPQKHQFETEIKNLNFFMLHWTIIARAKYFPSHQTTACLWKSFMFVGIVAGLVGCGMHAYCHICCNSYLHLMLRTDVPQTTILGGGFSYS